MRTRTRAEARDYIDQYVGSDCPRNEQQPLIPDEVGIALRRAVETLYLQPACRKKALQFGHRIHEVRRDAGLIPRHE